MNTKDPLCTQATPYDMLGIDRGADRGSIVRAFAMALTKRQYSQPELQQARTTLLRPEDRALVDVLYYDADTLARLSPNPLQDPSCLNAERRGATAEAWRQVLLERFPDVEGIHSLAVLWYWWAEEATQRYLEGRNLVDGRPHLAERWEKTLGYWSALLGSPQAWAQVTGLKDGEQVSVTREEMENRIRDRLVALQQAGAEGGRSALAERFGELQLMLRSELETTRHMLACSRSPLGDGMEGMGCGRVLLEELDLLRSVRSRVGQYYGQGEDGRHMEYVRNALSAHWKVAQLVSARRWDSALEAMDELPSRVSGREEVQELRAEALMGHARNQMSLGEVTGAVESWAEAIELDGGGAQAKRATDSLLDACRQLSDCADSQLETVANALKRAQLVLPRNEALRRISGQVGDRLCKEPISTINRVQTEAKEALESGGVTDALRRRWRTDWRPAFNRAIERLEEARSLGSERAADQVDVGRRVRDQFVTLFKEEPRWTRYVKAANAAAGRDDWEEAARFMRSALSGAPISERGGLRPQLAICLHNDANERMNSSVVQRAMQGQGSSYEKQQARDLVEKAVDELEEAKSLNPGEEHIEKALQTAQMVGMLLGAAGVSVPSSTTSTGSRSRYRPQESLAKKRAAGRFWVGVAIVLLALACGWLTYRYPSAWAVVGGASLACLGIIWGTAKGEGLAKLTTLDWIAAFLAGVRLGTNGKTWLVILVAVIAFLAYGSGLGAQD